MSEWPSDLSAWAAGFGDTADAAEAVAKAAQGRGWLSEDPLRSPVRYMGTYRHLTKKLLGALPDHTLWVEPFCGPGDFFLAKRQSPEEVVNDKDERIIRIWRFLKGLSDGDIRTLKRRNWTLTRQQFEKVKQHRPSTDLDFFYKVAYMSAHGIYGGQRVLRSESTVNGTPNLHGLGRTLELGDRLERIRARLAKVKIINGDYRAVFEKYGGRADALFFIDPPYPSTTHYYRVADVDFADLGARAQAVKGKFITLYEATKEWRVFKGPGVERARFRRSSRKLVWSKDPARRASQEANEDKNGSFAYVISNVPGYAGKVARSVSKAAADELLGELMGEAPAAAEVAKAAAFDRPIPIFKAAGAEGEEQRVVFGEVLVPDDRDSQGDIYDAPTVEAAAHGFLAKWVRGRLGEQHQKRLVGEVDLLESYIAPCDFSVNGRKIKAGTWLMKWKVHSDALWQKIKSGAITGFSIGGSAKKQPG